MDLFAPGKRLVVALSGGQDSTCLLHAVLLLKRHIPLHVVAAHVDHGLRSASADEAQSVIRGASAMGADEAGIWRVDVGAYRRAGGAGSVQQAARAARYQALAVAAVQTGADGLLVAHTADDQAETVLLHLLRGAGLDGLGGMRMLERVRVADFGPPVAERAEWGVSLPDQLILARPLLTVARDVTAAYCAAFQLPVLEDPSNERRVYTRNRIRLDLLPLLRTFNPRATRLLARLADLASEDAAALEALAEERWLSLATAAEEWPGAYRLPLAAWRVLHRGLQRLVLRVGLRHLLGTLRDVPSGAIEDALDGLDRPGATGRAYHLPGGVELRVERHTFVLRPGGDPAG